MYQQPAVHKPLQPVMPPPHPQIYGEKLMPTPNYSRRATNEVLGVVLHHTALTTLEETFDILTNPEKKAGTHVVIDTDGTRYIMAEPTVVTYHAGLSILNGRERCNLFTIGIEFQGNTLEKPLTNDQIASGIQYLLPIISKYHIPLENIVTHEKVRMAYIEKYPEKRNLAKIDITSTEYLRFMTSLRKTIRNLLIRGRSIYDPEIENSFDEDIYKSVNWP